MPADVSIRFRAESQQARKEVQILRGTLTQLNKTLVENRNALLTSTGEERKRIQAVQAANAVQKAALQQQIREAQGRKQAIADLQRETRERQRAAAQQAAAAQRVGKAQEQAARRASAAQSALIADLTIGARVVYRELSRLTTGFVGAAANMETFRNSVQAVTGDATETNRILADLLQLTVELVGIDTGTLISYAGRLMATGLSAEEAITAIRGVTERVAEQGKAASVTARVMEQVTQSFNAGIATMQDFRPILREMPTFWRDASNALGTNITNLEDFRQAADAAGGNTQALLLVLEEMGRVSLGANLDTLNAQIDILQDQSQLLAAELGEHLVPAIVSIVKEVNVWIERFRNMDDRAQAAIAWAVALTTALTGLGAIIGTATLGFGALSASLGALTGASGIAGVAAGFGGLTAALAAAAPYIAVGGVIIAGIALLAKAINDTSESAQVLRTEITRLDAVTRVYNLTTGKLEEVTGDQAAAFAVFQQRVKNAQDDVGNITNLLRNNRMEQEALTTAMAKASGDAIPELQNQLKSLTAEEQELSQALDDATDKLQNLRFEVVPDDAELTAPIESLEEQLIRAADQVIRLQGAFREVSRGDDIQSIEKAASNLTAALDRELSIQLMNAELTAAERLDLELTHAREVEGVTTDTQNRIREIAKETTEAQAEAVERQTDAQIASAARARSAEVARWEAAAAAGASYAAQLSEIGSPEQRQRFVQIVEQLQDQGVTLEQARAEAARYIPILAAISNPIQAADLAYQNFSSTLVDESNRSADAVANLLSGVQALGVALGERLPDTAGALERSAENEARYFQQNPVGPTLDDIRQEAGEQGRDFVNALFGRQDRAAEREATQELNEMASAIDSVIGELSTFEGDLGGLAQRIGQFDIAGLASGNPLSLATLPFQLHDAFTFDQRQADANRPALDRQNRALFERGEFGIPPDLLALGRGQLDTAAGAAGRSGFGGRSLLELLDNLDPQIGRTTLDEVATIPDRIIETIQTFTDQVIEGLTDELAQATFNLDFAKQTGGDVQGALQDVIDANTALYQTQIDAYNLQRQATGRAIGNVDELNRILNTLNNQARLQLADGPQNAQQFLAANNITRGLTPGQDDQERGVVFDPNAPAETTPETAETIADNALADALRITQEAIAIINTGITRLDNAVSQSNDPAEIADLLDQIADQIPESYRLRREALQAQYDAGEITREALNMGIANLNIEESAALEQNSDQMLANALRVNQAQIDAISVDVSELENRISQSNDPAEIESLLQQISEQIPEIYRLRRNVLSAQYAAGEITLSAINTGIAALNIEESAAIEQNSDAQLANTLRINQEVQTAISTEISGLEQTISTSNDPAEIESLLIEIAEQIPEIYRLRREALQAQYDAGEITLTALHTGLAALNIEEAAAIEQNSDAQLANLFSDHNADIALIANTVSIVSEAIRNSTDPEEIARLLVDLRTAIMEKYRLQREFLQAQLDAEEITIKQYQGRIGNLNIQESAQLGSADSLALTETQDIADTAQAAADAAQRTAAQNAAAAQRTAAQNAAAAQRAAAQAAQAAQRAADEALANALRANQDQQGAIDVEISRLENVISTSNDPAEIVQLLMQIAEQIPGIYTLRREALQTQFDAGKLTQEGLENGIAALNIEESAAIEQNSDAQLANALRINQEAQGTINTQIAGLENAISQSNDPAEIANLLMQIAEQIPEIYRLRREALQAQFDAGEITLEALNTGTTQLNIAESAAIEQNSDQMLANAISEHNTNTLLINNEITTLENAISQSNDPAEIAELTNDLREAILRKYALQRQILQAQLDAEEITAGFYAAQLGSLNIQETGALSAADTIANTRTTNIADSAAQEANTQAQITNSLLQNAIQRAEAGLTDSTSEQDFETRRQTLITAIGEFYDAEEQRISQLMLSEDELQNLREDNEFARQRALGRATNVENRFTTARIRAEETAQDEIERIRDEAIEREERRQREIQGLKDDALDVERDRANALVELEQDTQDRILDIQRDANRSREDLQREFGRDIEDILRDAGVDDTFFLSGDFQAIQRLAQIPGGDALRERLGGLGIDLSEDDFGQISDLARQRGRDQQDIDTREQRRTQDIRATAFLSAEQINQQATTTAQAIATQLAEIQAPANEAETTTAEAAVMTAEGTTEIAASTQATAEAQPAIMESLEPLSEIRDFEQQILETLGLSLAAHTRAGINLEALVSTARGGNTARNRLIEQIEGFGATLPDAVAVAIAASTTTEPAVRTEINELLELTRPQLPNNLRQDIINDIIQPTRADVPMRDITNLTQRIGAAEALSATREVPTSFTADTVNVSGGVVNVSGGSAGRESETPQSQFPVESDELRADITLEFPDGTIQEINNQMLRLKQQDRT